MALVKKIETEQAIQDRTEVHASDGAVGDGSDGQGH
ncbi:hypothetical protein A8924_6354 [Saccharopolyspora erythraea NRRL 2338]|nr:hypothetical protein A8924_6354 [Saccharopolyspora erythraea NRRL 2338]